MVPTTIKCWLSNVHELFLCIGFSFSGCYLSQQLSQNNILLTTIKFKNFQDYFVKFKDFKTLNLVQSISFHNHTHSPSLTLALQYLLLPTSQVMCFDKFRTHLHHWPIIVDYHLQNINNIAAHGTFTYQKAAQDSALSEIYVHIKAW